MLTHILTAARSLAAAAFLSVGCGSSAPPTFVPVVAGTVTLNGVPYKPAKGERVLLMFKDTDTLNGSEVGVDKDGGFRATGTAGAGLPATTYVIEVRLFGRPPDSPLFPGRDAPNAGAPVFAILKQKVVVKPGVAPVELDLSQWE